MHWEYRDIWQYIWLAENRNWKFILVWDQRNKCIMHEKGKIKERDKGECYGERQRERDLEKLVHSKNWKCWDMVKFLPKPKVSKLSREFG